jgi:RNA polymerase sigma-70 factor (ECF subfamily)
MQTDPDFEFVRRCQTEIGAARDDAFRELFENYKDRVFNLSVRLLGNQTDAADVTQDAFIAVFKKIHEFRFSSRFYTWLYRVVYNLCMDHRRRAPGDASRGAVSANDERADSVLANIRDPAPLPFEQISEEESRARVVERALKRLSEPLRAAIVLRYMEDLRYDEIADVLGCSVGTVKSRLSRAHHFLQELLRPTEDRHEPRQTPDPS